MSDIVLHKCCSLETAVSDQRHRSADGDRRRVSSEAGNVDGRSKL